MACKWRIRHKLMLGLGLVVAILALLLGGTLKGLMSYVATMKSMDSKLAELHRADDLKIKINELAAPPDPGLGIADEPVRLHAKALLARQALASYQVQLQYTVDKRRDTDKGREEAGLIKALQERFDRLDSAIADALAPTLMRGRGTGSIRNDAKVDHAIQELVRASVELQEAIYNDLYKRIDIAKADHKNSLVVVISTSVLGVLLMVGLLRFFYRWVFYPVRDLENGVGRVAQGDFAHRIEVHSGDEMEDLAAAFNDMAQRLQELYSDLSRQVNERSRQLVRSERLASVGFLAAGVAHEINNPLASIAFCSEALEQRLSNVLSVSSSAGKGFTSVESAVVTKYLKMIQEEAFRCKAITQRLLEFSRSGDRIREPTDLAEVIQSVLDVVQHLQNVKGKQIVYQSSGRLIAWVNSQEIKSVVLNLVVNALDSMDDGGILNITLEPRSGMAQMRFIDSGCGMTPEVLENIFEPFFTRSRTGKGTGLGLTISHRIVSQHGGDIEAASAGMNQGSSFTIRLPLQPAESVAPLPGSSPESAPSRARAQNVIQEETIGHAAA